METASPAWETALAGFAKDLAHRRRSGRTVELRLYQMRRFARWVTVPPERVRLDQVLDYLSRRPGIADGTYNVMRGSLRAFFIWAKETGLITTDLAESLPPPASQKRTSRPATQAAIDEALQKADPRSRLMVMLAAIAGLKAMEIASCHPKDIHRDNDGRWTLDAHGTSGQVRPVILREDIAQAILVGGTKEFTFPGRVGGHVSSAYVSRLISETLPDGVSSEQLRKAFTVSQVTLAWRELASYHSPKAMRLSEVVNLGDSQNVAYHLARIESGLVHDDFALAIGQSKELMETVFYKVLDSKKVPHSDTEKLPALYNKVSDALAADAPADVQNRDEIRTIMRSLAGVVQNVGEMRGDLGTGHGSGDDLPTIADERHARLTFNAAVAVVEFVADTWRSQQQ